ncbi:hypothetical protein DE146DRAFT_647241 [Phaeosphaeria sp. MPI-PUGE-AT-0046c]|nr:hypothetical protein DE146DRAFT_647241 [Phaeosphaeria sp. MPI-PUGE-AT-0046c]
MLMRAPRLNSTMPASTITTIINPAMAESQCPSCTCDASDSALSTAANIISLVTLAYVLLVGLLYQVALHQGSKGSTEGLREDVRSLRQKHSNLRSMYNFQQADCSNVPLGVQMNMLDLLDTDLDSVERQMNRTFTFAADGSEIGEKWYVVWTQMSNAGRRAFLQRRVRALDKRVEKCVAAGITYFTKLNLEHEEQMREPERQMQEIQVIQQRSMTMDTGLGRGL